MTMTLMSSMVTHHRCHLQIFTMSQESVLAAYRSNTLTSALSNSPDDSVVDPLIAWLKVASASRHQPRVLCAISRVQSALPVLFH
jgi:hypothetical protein